MLAGRCLILRLISRVPSTPLSNYAVAMLASDSFDSTVRFFRSTLLFYAFVRLPVDRNFYPIVIADELSSLRDGNSSLHRTVCRHAPFLPRVRLLSDSPRVEWL
jgi:hypothetical protein